MSLQELHQRYLNIAKKSLEFLKAEGFQKKGMKYIKQKEMFCFNVYPFVAKPYLNTESRYDFDIAWEVRASEEHLIKIATFIWNSKNLSPVLLLYNEIGPTFNNHSTGLTDKDPPHFDEDYMKGIQEKIKTVVLPLFERIHSLDDVIHLAEEEAKLEREKREFFPYAIYDKLALFYAAKGWKEKALEMCDKDIEMTPATARRLAEEDKKKYVKYFEQLKKG